MNGPRVSVITPAYNAGRYLEEAVASVLSQTFGRWEHIIIDDGSTDGSVGEIRERLKEDERFRFLTQPNAGVARARNVGYRLTSPQSDFLIFLDADDLLEAGALASMVAYLDATPAAGMVYTPCSLIDASGDFHSDTSVEDRWQERFRLRGFRIVRLKPAERVTPFESLFMLPNLIPSNTMIRRSAYARTTGWDETFGQPAEDTDLFLRIALSTEVHRLPDPLARYRRHEAQSTAARERNIRQTRRLYTKWAELAKTDAAHARTINRAIMAREGIAIPTMWVLYGSRQLLAGHLAEAGTCYLRCVGFGGRFWAGRALARIRGVSRRVRAP